MIQEYLLSILIFLPVIGSVLVALLPRSFVQFARYIALSVTVVQVLLILSVLLNIGNVSGINNIAEFEYAERVTWFMIDLADLGLLKAEYFVALDGLNVTLVALAVLVMLVALISSWKVSKRVKGYFALFLLLNGAIIGCFVALDFLLFYLFFEFMLLPMYFLIGLWGGPKREYAAIKFFLYTLLGSVLILIVMIGLYASTINPQETAVAMDMAAPTEANAISQVQQMLRQGAIPSDKLVHTFNMVYMTQPENIIPGSILDTASAKLVMGLPIRSLAFLIIFIGFAIKVPVIPLHTWLPDAHVEAPTAISVILAGILLKIGGYGMLRGGMLIFPDVVPDIAWGIGLLGLISIIYGGLNALASKDLKRLIAYSSVSHMGFVILGMAALTTEGLSGSIYQMVSHGVISAALFVVVGVLYDRTHDRLIANYSGLGTIMPKYTAVTVAFFFASMGLPGFSGFIAEIFVLLGAFGSSLLPKWMAILATTGLIISAAYYLWTIQRIFFGPQFIKVKHDELSDLTSREWLMLTPLLVAALALGIFPSLILDYISGSVNVIISLLG